METRDLGAGGPRVSRLGLGLAAVGRPAYITLGRGQSLGADRSVATMRRRTHALLDEAWRLGIRYVDAARSYGRAEEFLAAWLAERPDAARPTVGSKWGYEYTGGWQLDADEHERKEHSLTMFTRQLGETRAHLGDALDVYQVHSATLDSGLLDDDELLDGLAALRDAGTLIGVSLSGPGQATTLERSRRVVRGGRPLFATVQATWNVLEPSAGPQLRAAADAGMGVVVKEAVANGRLTPASDEPGVRGPLDVVARRHGVPTDAVALAAVLAQPWADVVLSGAATVAQLRDNVAATGVELSDDDLSVLGGLAEEPDDYWWRRAGLAWS